MLGEEKIDIWKNKKKDITTTSNTPENSNSKKINLNNSLNSKNEETIKIEDNLSYEGEVVKVFGIYDPADFDFNLNMWSTSDAEDIRASIKRLNKIRLSKTSSEIFENIFLSFSYPPEGMSDNEFVKLKINWLIDNNKSDLIESFLKQNEEFEGKSRVIQYLVDENIAQANIKRSCEKIKFIDSKIRDPYLEKFKIYCFVFSNQKSQGSAFTRSFKRAKKI